jgi:hypothetical protein
VALEVDIRWDDATWKICVGLICCNATIGSLEKCGGLAGRCEGMLAGHPACGEGGHHAVPRWQLPCLAATVSMGKGAQWECSFAAGAGCVYLEPRLKVAQELLFKLKHDLANVEGMHSILVVHTQEASAPLFSLYSVMRTRDICNCP